jgi:hypothetical protein
MEMRQWSQGEGLKIFENRSHFTMSSEQLDHQLIPRSTEQSSHLFFVDILALPLHCR